MPLREIVSDVILPTSSLLLCLTHENVSVYRLCKFFCLLDSFSTRPKSRRFTFNQCDNYTPCPPSSRKVKFFCNRICVWWDGSVCRELFVIVLSAIWLSFSDIHQVLRRYWNLHGYNICLSSSSSRLCYSAWMNLFSVIRSWNRYFFSL